MRYTDVRDPERWKNLSARFLGILTIAAVADAYMDKAREYGDIETSFPSVMESLNVRAPGKRQGEFVKAALKAKTANNYDWVDDDIAYHRVVSPVAEELDNAFLDYVVDAEDLI